MKVTADSLKEYLKEMFEKAGFSAGDAEICADCTVQTNLWGVDSHGILRTPAYINRVEHGAVNPKPTIRFLKGEGGPLALMSGDDGMGYVVADRCMDAAVEKAKQFGMGTVLVNRSNHFGAAALFTRKAADAGMLGIATTNVVPNIGMPGNTKAVTGNNPVALAAPLNEPYNFSLDISMSAVSGGKLLLAIKKGEKIPTNWAIDKNGNPTEDPQAGFDGIFLPTGMHKGLGMSLFIDLMTGLLSGGPFLKDMLGMYKYPDKPSGTTHLFSVIDPGFFMSGEEYDKRIDAWVKMIKDTPMADPSKKQIIPGELEYLKEQERLRDGIPLPEELVGDLRKLEEKLGMTNRL